MAAYVLIGDFNWGDYCNCIHRMSSKLVPSGNGLSSVMVLHSNRTDNNRLSQLKQRKVDDITPLPSAPGIRSNRLEIFNYILGASLNRASLISYKSPYLSFFLL